VSLGAEPTAAAAEPRDAAAERIVDEVLGEEVDWVSLVRRYPLTAVAVAAGAGFLLARRHGSEIVGALSDLASRRVSQSVERLTRAVS
jgi:hypothetical protein